jgi:hypothetical protein
MTTRWRHRGRYCGLELPAWLPVFQVPNGPLLLQHLGPCTRPRWGRTWRGSAPRMTSPRWLAVVVVEGVSQGRGEDTP